MSIEQTLIDVCTKKKYTFKSVHNGKDVKTYVVAKLLTMKQTGAKHTFEANINVFQKRNSLHITVPLYPAGLTGRKVGVFYQVMGELSAGLDGNAKIVPYPWDKSNRPVIMLAHDLSKVDQDWLVANFRYLEQIFIGTRPLLDRAIQHLNLKFDEQARVKGNYLVLMEDLRKLLE